MHKPKTSPDDQVTPRKFKIGRRATALKNMPTFRKEAQELIDKVLAEGGSNPVWGAGVFVRHIVFGLFRSVSLCGRFVGDVSTAPMPTLIGVPCPTCIRLWNRAMDRRNIDIEATNEKAITKLSDELDELLGTTGIDAAVSRLRALGGNRALRKAVLDRLDERGVDLRGMLARRVKPCDWI